MQEQVKADRAMRDSLFRKNLRIIDDGGMDKVPYSIQLQLMAEDDERFSEGEVQAFKHVIEHELALYESRGLFFGPLHIESAPKAELDPECNIYRCPDLLAMETSFISASNASAVVLVEGFTAFLELSRCQARRGEEVIFLTGPSIPRLAVRRLIRRLHEEAGLPVYVLADFDTWGFFNVSLLRRGVLDPAGSHPSCQLSEVRLLSLRASDLDELISAGAKTRPWEPVWDIRLECLSQYACFQSAAWRTEFEGFRRMHLAMTLESAISAVGSLKFFKSFVMDRIDHGEFLATA